MKLGKLICIVSLSFIFLCHNVLAKISHEDSLENLYENFSDQDDTLNFEAYIENARITRANIINDLKEDENIYKTCKKYIERLEKNPEDIAALLILGDLYLIRFKNADQALKCYESAYWLTCPEFNADVLYHLGQYYHFQGLSQEAILCFQASIALNEDYLNMFNYQKMNIFINQWVQ
jgi:tetratricopeptide (TPR) repeat protein